MEPTLNRIRLDPSYMEQRRLRICRKHSVLKTNNDGVPLGNHISFKRQGMWFTYELLGFSRSDVEEVFNWARVSDCIRTRDIAIDDS